MFSSITRNNFLDFITIILIWAEYFGEKLYCPKNFTYFFIKGKTYLFYLKTIGKKYHLYISRVYEEQV